MIPHGRGTWMEQVAQTLIESDLQLLEKLGAGLVIVDPAGKVALWSDAAAATFGMAAEEALGKAWTDCLTLIRGDGSGGATMRVEVTQPGGWHGPVSFRNRAGETVSVRAHFQHIDLPQFRGKPGVAALFWPGSGPDLAVSGPEAVHLPYRDLFRHSPEGLFLVELSGLILDANSAGATMFGTKPEDMIGLNVADFLEQPRDLEQARADLVGSGSVVTYLRFKTPAGGSFPAEAVVSLAASEPRSLALVRLRDRTSDERMARLDTELAILARPADVILEVEEVAQRAVEIVAAAWGADASLATLDDNLGHSTVAGTGSPEARRIGLRGLDADSALSSLIAANDGPFQLDLRDSPAWSRKIKSLGLTSLWAIPVIFDADRIGSMVLLWAGASPASMSSELAAGIGKQVGLAVGSAATRAALRREMELRESLATPARIGSVVVEQMTDAIVTTNADGRITTVNPAGERLYGFAEDDVVGHSLPEVFEQLGLSGSPLDMDATGRTSAMGYWQGRVVHRPIVGGRAGEQIVVELSQTTIRDSHRRPAGLILMSREVTASARLEAEAAALSSLAVATERARTRREVADVALERLSEATLADAAVIATWAEEGGQSTIEGSRGLTSDFLELIRLADGPALRAALAVPGAILPLADTRPFVRSADPTTAVRKEGLATGFLVDLRLRDESVGFLALASRNPAWVRPSDAVVLQAAAQVVGALKNARLVERLEHGLEQERRLTAQLEGLVGVTRLPSGETDEGTVARFLLDRIISTLGAFSGFLVRLDGPDRFRVVAAHRVDHDMLKLLAQMPAGKFEFWARLTESQVHAAFMDRVVVDTFSPGMARMRDLGLTAYAAFPIHEGDAPIGAFVCQFVGQEDTPSTATERTIDALGRIIDIAYANVRMSESLNEAAEHERRLTAELRALQELTLLGAATDDRDRLARETIEAVVVSTGAIGGGYILVNADTAGLEPIVWVGQASPSWAVLEASGSLAPELPPLDRFRSSPGVWLSRAGVGTTPTDDSGTEPGDTAPGARALLPLRVDGRLAGMLQLEWSATPRVEQFDDHFLEPMARICSISLANFRLRGDLIRGTRDQVALNRRLESLDELTRIGEEASSFDELAHRTVSLVREALGATGVCYMLLEPGHHFDTKAVAGDIGAFRHWLNGVPAKDAPGGTILLGGGGSCLSDFGPGRVNERVLPLARAAGFRSFGAIPVRTGEELAGAILCFFEQPAASSPVNEQALNSVARIGGIALANFRLRERLVSSEERYRTLFEESPDALFVTALDGTVLDANDAAVRLYRVNRGEVLGRYFGQFIVANERDMARRRQIVWAHGRGQFKDRGRRPDGTEFQIEIEVRVVELGGQRRFLTLVRDVSDQERLMGELAQAQKMEAIGQLVSGVAHELNNPLAAIIAFSQLIRTDNRLPDDMKHDAGLLVQEADRTKRIVQGLLDFARQRPPERRQTSMRDLVQSVLDLQSYALNANNVQAEVEIPIDLPAVDLDRAQMQQVLLNLTINAIQAMRPRDHSIPAHLWISAMPVDATRAGSDLKPDGPHDEPRVRVTIRDDGPGVPESSRSKLFLPFFTTKQPGEGTGLGLSVSFGIVAAHGGHLWYEPGAAGVGSCFIFELPVHAHAEEETTSSAVEPGPSSDHSASSPTGTPAGRTGRGRSRGPKPKSVATATAGKPARSHGSARLVAAGKGESVTDSGTQATPVNVSAEGAADLTEQPKTARPRVLALDDEGSIREFLKKLLAKEGMDCDSYQSGAEALDGLALHSYDAMLIDHRMAGMSGTDFYEAAAGSQPELAKRAIFMSGDVLNPDLRGFATERGIRLLAKPFDIDAVVRVVREAMAEAAGETTRS